MKLDARRILIATHGLQYLAGAELEAVQFARALRDRGADVTLFTFLLGAEFNWRLQGYGFRIVALNSMDKSALTAGKFDLMWTQHTPVLDYLLFDAEVAAKQIVFRSLSPFEPLEAPPLYAGELSACLANSEENLEVIRVQGIDHDNMAVFPNAVTGDFFGGFSNPPSRELSRLAVISNHIPQEVLEVSIRFYIPHKRRVYYNANSQ